MLKNICPRLNENNHAVASRQTDHYNCVAWAAHSLIWVIWPDDDEVYAWPPELPRGETVGNLAAFFRMLGFVMCASTALEEGFEKIAIYADKDGPQHVARQLSDGKWTSKLGVLADINHSLAWDVGGGQYGEVVITMKRPVNDALPPLPQLHPVKIVV